MRKHTPPFSPEVRERAVRMVREHQGEHGSQSRRGPRRRAPIRSGWCCDDHFRPSSCRETRRGSRGAQKGRAGQRWWLKGERPHKLCDRRFDWAHTKGRAHVTNVSSQAQLIMLWRVIPEFRDPGTPFSALQKERVFFRTAKFAV